jgi:RHS repeat-associated protein
VQSTDKVTEEFTGKELDDETGLNYFGARYYDPMIGIWNTVDPARQFTSPYLYAGNGMNPVVGIDPDGRAFINERGLQLYDKAVQNNFWNNADIKSAYEYAYATNTKISIELKGVIYRTVNGEIVNYAGLAIPSIFDKIKAFFGFETNALHSATVLLGDAQLWADKLGISYDEAQARIAAHEFKAHIENYSSQGGTEVEHQKVIDFDNRLFGEEE